MLRLIKKKKKINICCLFQKIFFFLFYKSFFFFFFFNDTATTEIYTLSLHDALPICQPATQPAVCLPGRDRGGGAGGVHPRPDQDRKSTRLNSSHVEISYAVFCL